ncbi:MAG: flagellar assembly protein FliW [Deltaproteobacteria bacterium]|nr:MAG: flagellar assembly protein FliW [Deltaproteobacteria bacterium]
MPMDSAQIPGADHESEPKGTLTVETTRFGRVQIDGKRIIHFPEGVLGFPDQKRFVILEHKPGSPFCWLQSVDSPDLAFVMMSPFLVKKDYLEDLPQSEKEIFQGEDAKDLVVFAFVTIPEGQVEKMTINLLGPILIDVKKRVGRQLVLAGSDYTTRHPVVSSK